MPAGQGIGRAGSVSAPGTATCTGPDPAVLRTIIWYHCDVRDDVCAARLREGCVAFTRCRVRTAAATFAAAVLGSVSCRPTTAPSPGRCRALAGFRATVVKGA